MAEIGTDSNNEHKRQPPIEANKSARHCEKVYARKEQRRGENCRQIEAEKSKEEKVISLYRQTELVLMCT